MEVELDNNERELLAAYLLVCTARGVAKDKERAGGKGSRSPSGGDRPPFARAVVPPEVTAKRATVSAGGGIIHRQMPICSRQLSNARPALAKAPGLSVGRRHGGAVFWMDGSQRFEITYVKPKLQPPKSNLDDKYVLEYSNLLPDLILVT